MQRKKKKEEVIGKGCYLQLIFRDGTPAKFAVIELNPRATLRLVTWEFDRLVRDSDTYSGYVIYRGDSILYNSLNSKCDTSD